MGSIDGHFRVAGTGAANRFQLALDKEQFIAFLFVDIDLIITDLRIFAQHDFQFCHPSFTFAFNAGPPSLTRTHSL